MSEETERLYKEGIGVEYDPNDGVLRIFQVPPDGSEPVSISMSKAQALYLHRSLGEMLGPDADA